MTGDSLSDTEMASFDITAMVRHATTGENPVAQRHLFSVGAVGAAVILDRVHTIPRSVTYLAEIVRAGGTRAAAELAEPLPLADQSAAVRPWLATAADSDAGIVTDDLLYRWLRAVATVLAFRVTNRLGRR